MTTKTIPTMKEIRKATGRKRLMLFARYLESLKFNDENRGVTNTKMFNLLNYTRRDRNSCGTPSCIAGHAAFVRDPSIVKNKWGFVHENAAEFLGLDYGTADALFIPKTDPQMHREAAKMRGYNEDMGVYGLITPKLAAKAVRNVARGAKTQREVWAGTILGRNIPVSE